MRRLPDFGCQWTGCQVALGVGQGTVDSVGTEETDCDRTVLGLVFARAVQGFGETGLSFPAVPLGME